MKTLLRICGVGLILFGIFLIMWGITSGPWAPGQQLFMLGHGLVSLIIGIGVVRLNKIAMYCVFPLAFYTFWVIRLEIQHGAPVALMAGLLMIAAILCSIIYLIKLVRD